MSREQIQSKIERMSEILDKVEAEDVKSDASKVLKEIGGIYNDSVDSLFAESKRRKEKILELEPKLSTYEDEIESLKIKSNTTELESELNDLREYKKTQIGNQRKSFVNDIKPLIENPKWEIAKKKLVLPEPDKDGNLDFESISNEDMLKNSSTLQDLNDLEYFKTEEKPKPPVHSKRFNENTDEKVIIKNKKDMRIHMQRVLNENK